MSDVIVIGAGPAGLTAAYELSKLGIKSTLIEANNRVGGISRTENYKGYRFDMGGHRFFSKTPYINQIWEEILGHEFIQMPRLSRIQYQGHFFDYPLKPFNAMAGLGIKESIKVFINYTQSKLVPFQKDEHNFEQWVVNRFGSRLYQIFFKTYSEKVWGLPCREISADWANQRIQNLSLRKAVYHALLSQINRRDQNQIVTLIDKFHYPRLGPGMMWERCADRLAERGNPTRINEQIVRIRHDTKRVLSVHAQGNDGKITAYKGDQFISSMSLKDLVQSLDPKPPKEIIAAALNLKYRDYLTVILIVNKSDIFPDNWIYIHSPEVKMGRIQNFKNWSRDMVPEPSKTSLGLEYFLWDTDDMWHWPDNQLIDMGKKECESIGIISAQDVIDGTVVRVRKAYPVYDQTYHHSVELIRHYLESFSNFQTIGRNGQHRYNNQDHSMLTGIYAARNIAGQTYNVWSVNMESDFHEETAMPESLLRREIDALFSRMDPIALGAAVGLVSGFLIFMATLVLIIKGGHLIGPTLSLLKHYLPGYQVDWKGALLGFFETGIIGFILGSGFAWLRNFGVYIYARRTRVKQEAKTKQHLLEEV